ncbi:Sapep family Mn(2+)-dependent dipeptidase [Harryflintia acetispora]|uniref:Succinyl-diaminopimelate desuccinylase n=1 Tax=Harryflintia acetispora TaxID=1849041 RepID=A0A9X8Y9I2_9FIRM|nr:Sapep family Mn(2+)-dependent dipeptidase [Harryflintia acetispora]TCL45488.1 succinyl-diaminopimelate desuccinylase [Harryflintia acetispora]
MLDQKLQEQIDSFVEKNRNQIVETVRALVQIDSLRGEPLPGAPYGAGPRRALDRALAICKEQGLSVADHEGYCGSAVLPGQEGEIALAAHLDIVPVGEGWSVDPFSATLRDGYIVGRGARDNKGAFAADLYAMLCLRELGVPLRHSLRLIMGCNEETGMKDMEYYLSKNKAPDFTLVTDCSFPVCHGEKGGFSGDIIFPKPARVRRAGGGVARNIVPAQASAEVDCQGLDKERILALAGEAEGICAKMEGDTLTVSAEGISFHAAFPEGSKNAIGHLLRFLCGAGLLEGEDFERGRFLADTLEHYYGETLGIACADAQTGKLTCVGGLLFEENDGLHLNLDIRYPVTASGGEIGKKIAAACKEHGCSFVVTKDDAGTYVPAEHPAVQTLCRVYRELTGSERAPYTMGGGTYARKFPNAVAFGPGDPEEKLPYEPGRGDAHQPDESQNIGILLRSIKIYVAAILELDKIL